jgi:anti-anti-sigma factor
MSTAGEAVRFEVRAWPDRDRVIVAPHGELDVATVGAVRAALDELRAAGWASIVLDLREVTFIDSTGLSLLLEADGAARSTGTAFAIVDGSPAVAWLLDLVGLSEHFKRVRVS